MNKRYKIFIFILLIIPYIKPPVYIIGNTLDSIYDIYKIIVSICIFVWYISKYRTISKMLLALTIFQTTFIISTIFNGNFTNVWSQFVQLISVVGICALTELGIKEDCKSYLKSICIVLTVLSLINVYTMIKYSKTGMYVDQLMHWQYYFLGYDNSSFFIEFPLFICLTCYSYILKNKISIWVWPIFIIIGFSYLYVNSITSVIMILLYFIFILTNKSPIWKKILNFKVILIFIIFMFIFIVMFNGQIYFEKFLENHLGKNTTLSGRTFIWEKARYYITKAPIFGYGLQNTSILLERFGINHVHNIILDILYNGGIIALIAYLYIIKLCIKMINKDRNSFISNNISMGLFIYLFASIFDYYNNKYIIFILFIFAQYINKLNEESEKLKKIKEKNKNE